MNRRVSFSDAINLNEHGPGEDNDGTFDNGVMGFTDHTLAPMRIDMSELEPYMRSKKNAYNIMAIEGK